MPRKTKKPPEPSAPNVPAYIVTFSDMVTLLLTFFVMLLSLAQVQDPELFNRSRDAFNEHINCYGLGLLTGKQLVPEFGKKKTKYYIPDPDEEEPARTVDSKEENLRRLFQKAAESMDVMPSRVGVSLSDYLPTTIHFAKGQATLNDTDRQYLDTMATEYRQESGTRKMQIYVLGLAADESTEKKQWTLSSLRAQAVADYLSETESFECPIYAWGSGPGGAWIQQETPLSQQSQIYIAFVRGG